MSGPGTMRRSALRLSDAISARPTAALVFVLSAAAFAVLLYAQGTRTLRLQAVVHTVPVEVRSPLTSTLTARHAQAGEAVTMGSRLATLDTRATRRALELVEREIAVVQAQLALQATQVRSEGQQDAFGALRARLEVDQTLRVSRSRNDGLRHALHAAIAWRDNVEKLVAQGAEPKSALLEAEQAVADARARQREAQTLASSSQQQSAALAGITVTPLDQLVAIQDTLTQASLALLTTRRDHLRAELEQAEVTAPAAGRLAELAPIGASTASPLPLAVIVPAQSHTLTAYLPAAGDQKLVPKAGQTVRLGAACSEPGKVLRVGARVEAAPEQLVGPLPNARMFGLPIYVQLPDACPMTPGMALQIEVVP